MKWLPTTSEIYWAIMFEHGDEMEAHGTISRLENSSLGHAHWMTEWGLRGADYPLIKLDRIEGRPATYWIAIITKEE
jgi:hypothetical protein